MQEFKHTPEEAFNRLQSLVDSFNQEPTGGVEGILSRAKEILLGVDPKSVRDLRGMAGADNSYGRALIAILRAHYAGAPLTHEMLEIETENTASEPAGQDSGYPDFYRTWDPEQKGETIDTYV